MKTNAFFISILLLVCCNNNNKNFIEGRVTYEKEIKSKNYTSTKDNFDVIIQDSILCFFYDVSKSSKSDSLIELIGFNPKINRGIIKSNSDTNLYFFDNSFKADSLITKSSGNDSIIDGKNCHSIFLTYKNEVVQVFYQNDYLSINGSMFNNFHQSKQIDLIRFTNTLPILFIETGSTYVIYNKINKSDLKRQDFDINKLFETTN